MAWTLYKEIKYDTDGIPGENLTDFPKLVSITTDSDIASELSGGGGIKFTSADGMTDLSFGLYPASDLANGTAVARVKLTLLTAANVGDVMCRLYYSSTESTTEDKAGTVDNDYLLFMPLEEDPSGSAPQMFDWVSETNIGTANNMESGDLTTGTVGNGLNFDGSNESVDCPYFTELISATNATLEAIVSKPSATTGLAGIGTSLNSSGGDRFAFVWFTDGNVYHSIETGATLSYPYVALAGTGPHQIAIAYNGSLSGIARCRAIHDGAVKTLTGGGADPAAALDPGNIPFRIGRLLGSGSTYANGVHDEVKVSTVTRSDNWLFYSYADEFTNGDTFTLGTEQGGGSSAALTGTATETIDESDVVTGGKTIIITLTGDTFVAAGTGPIGSTANTQAIIDGISAATSPAGGWNDEWRDKEVTSSVVRTSDTVCTITMSSQATLSGSYDISSQETITVTVPGAALTGGSPIVASPTFTVDAVSTGAQEFDRPFRRAFTRAFQGAF